MVVSQLHSTSSGGFLYFYRTRVNEYINLPADKRDAFRQQFNTVGHSDCLLAFSKRMAILAVREKSNKRIFEGLIAQCIEDSKDDRENQMILSLLNHSAAKIGCNPVELFEKAGYYATPKTRKIMLQFVYQNSSQKDIESMGYHEVIEEDGFRYKRDW